MELIYTMFSLYPIIQRNLQEQPVTILGYFVYPK